MHFNLQKSENKYWFFVISSWNKLWKITMFSHQILMVFLIVYLGHPCYCQCTFGLCSWAEWKTVKTNCASSYCTQERARTICCLDIGWSYQTCSRYCPGSGNSGYSESGNSGSSTLTCNHCTNGGTLRSNGRACDCVPGYYGTCCQYGKLTV